MSFQSLSKPSERLIVALDVPDFLSAKKLVEEISDEVIFYKIGLELMMSGDYFRIIEWLKNNNKKVFADLKLYDISETVGRAVANLAQYEIDMLTIHAASKSIMQQASANKKNIHLIAVTVLTNLDQQDLLEMGFDSKLSIEELVAKKAELALECGVNGVVASAMEAKNLRTKLGQNFSIVTPGIRLKELNKDDQKRVCDVETALSSGASHLVVGRPITRDFDPKSVARKFNELIGNIHSSSTLPPPPVIPA